jgi:hypothetical protein
MCLEMRPFLLPQCFTWNHLASRLPQGLQLEGLSPKIVPRGTFQQVKPLKRIAFCWNVGKPE